MFKLKNKKIITILMHKKVTSGHMYKPGLTELFMLLCIKMWEHLSGKKMGQDEQKC